MRAASRASARSCPIARTCPAASDEYDRQYMVFARAGRDVSFVLSSWDEGISRWRFNLPAGQLQRALHRHRGVRPHAAARRRERAHEAAVPPAHARGLPLRQRRRAAGDRDHRAPGQRAALRAAGQVGRAQQRRAGLEGAARTPRPACTGCGSRTRWGASALARGGQLPRRGVPRAADARGHRSAGRAAGQCRRARSWACR